MPPDDDRTRAMTEAYDEEARATEWLGPEIAFGLVREYVQPGQSILDLGIGTGLGSIPFREAGLKVHGMDVSEEMLEACRGKGFTDLTRHDLTRRPYPYASESMDQVVCVGVLQFFGDLSPMFGESARILRKGGLFVFAVGDRTEDESPEIVVGSEHTGSDASVTMYRHSARQIGTWMDGNGFTPLRDVAFTVYMDRDKKHTFQARAYVARKRGDIDQGLGGDA
jgi:predicted TPR repeat methyltransferase